VSSFGTNDDESKTPLPDRATSHEPRDHSTADKNPARPIVTTSHPAPILTQPAAMLVLFSLLTLLGTLSSFTSATALTYKLTPNEKECFYTHVVKQGAKVAFYFAVQSGGSFDSALRSMRTFNGMEVLTTNS
jgi:hypothetical protein